MKNTYSGSLKAIMSAASKARDKKVARHDRFRVSELKANSSTSHHPNQSHAVILRRVKMQEDLGVYMQAYAHAMNSVFNAKTLTVNSRSYANKSRMFIAPDHLNFESQDTKYLNMLAKHGQSTAKLDYWLDENGYFKSGAQQGDMSLDDIMTEIGQNIAALGPDFEKSFLEFINKHNRAATRPIQPQLIEKLNDEIMPIYKALTYAFSKERNDIGRVKVLTDTYSLKISISLKGTTRNHFLETNVLSSGYVQNPMAPIAGREMSAENNTPMSLAEFIEHVDALIEQRGPTFKTNYEHYLKSKLSLEAHQKPVRQKYTRR